MAFYPGAGQYAMGAEGYIEFDWKPEPYVIANQLFTAADELEDRSAPLALSRQIAIDDMRDHFMSETSPDGAKWEDWAESYEPYASQHNAGILRQTQALFGAAVSPAAYPVTDDAVFFSTAGLPEYGIYHQFGAERTHASAIDLIESGFEYAGNTLPARPFIGISSAAELEIIQVFDQWFAGIIAIIGAGGGGRVGKRHALRKGGRFVKASEFTG